MTAPKTYNVGFGSFGVEISHHFGGGVYAKGVTIPAGTVLSQHEHPYEHLSILAEGTVALRRGDALAEIHSGPKCLTIEAGIPHSVRAVTNAIWYCIHATDETDPAKVDDAVLESA